MSYNILADAYARHHASKLYRDVPKHCITWQHRFPLLIKELLHWSPDIICLQEVQHFAEIQGPLQQAGYCGTFLQRGGWRRDGCATFWKADRLQLLQRVPLRFSEHQLEDNVALLLRLQLRAPPMHPAASSPALSPSAPEGPPSTADLSATQSAPLPPSAVAPQHITAGSQPAVRVESHAGRHDSASLCPQPQGAAGSAGSAAGQPLPQLVVSNTHVCFDPAKGHIKLGQMRTLFHAAHQLGAPHGALAVLAGDFNTSPGSPLYGFMSEGVLDVTRTCRALMSGQKKGWGTPEFFLSMAQAGKPLLPSPPGMPASDAAPGMGTDMMEQQQRQQGQQQLVAPQPCSSVSGHLGVEDLAAAPHMPMACSQALVLGAALPERRGAVASVRAAIHALLSPFLPANGWTADALRSALGKEGAQQVARMRRARGARGAPAPAGSSLEAPEQGPAGMPASPAPDAACPVKGSSSQACKACVSSGVQDTAQVPVRGASAGVAAGGLAGSPGDGSTDADSSMQQDSAAERVLGSDGRGAFVFHPLRVRSTYQFATGCEPAFSSTHSGYHGCCDYLWFTPTSIPPPQPTQAASHLATPSGRAPAHKATGKPSKPALAGLKRATSSREPGHAYDALASTSVPPPHLPQPPTPLVHPAAAPLPAAAPAPPGDMQSAAAAQWAGAAAAASSARNSDGPLHAVSDASRQTGLAPMPLQPSPSFPARQERASVQGWERALPSTEEERSASALPAAACWSLTPVAVLAPPCMSKLPTGLPAPNWPSDHIPILAHYAITHGQPAQH